MNILVSHLGDSSAAINAESEINAECPTATVVIREETLNNAVGWAASNSVDIICRVSYGLDDVTNDTNGDLAWNNNIGIVHVFGEDDTQKEFSEPSCLDIICSVTQKSANYGNGLEFISRYNIKPQPFTGRVSGIIGQIMIDNPTWNFHDARQAIRQTCSNYSTGWVKDTGFGSIDKSAAKNVSDLGLMPPSRISMSRANNTLTFAWEDNWQTATTETVLARFTSDPSLTDTPTLAALYSGSGDEKTTYDLEATIGDWFFALLTLDNSDNYSRIESFVKFTPNNNANLEFVDSTSWAYHIKTNKWSKLSGLNVSKVRNIHHGTIDCNLLLTNCNLLRKYPSDTNTLFATKVKSKKYFLAGNKIRKFVAYLSGSSADVTVRIYNRKFSTDYKDYNISNITDNEWQGISSGYYGDYIEFIFEDINEFEQLLYLISTKGAKQ